MNDLVKIDMDEIQRLRDSGKKYEAHMLLQAYKEQSDKNKKQLKIEVRRYSQKVERHKCKNIGVCNYSSCYEEAVNSNHCEEHRKYYNAINKKSRDRKVNK